MKYLKYLFLRIALVIFILLVFNIIKGKVFWILEGGCIVATVIFGLLTEKSQFEEWEHIRVVINGILDFLLIIIAIVIYVLLY